MEDLKELTAEIKSLVQALKDPLGKNGRELEQYTIDEVSKILHCSVPSVRNLIKDNAFKALRYKGMVRISKGQVEKFIAKNTF
jgi:excisionase family DNA binding protein